MTASVARLVAAVEVRGLDCSPTAVRIERERHPHLRFQVADAIHTADRWGHQDLIVISEVLSYVADWRELVSKAARSAAFLCIGLYLPPNPMGWVKSFDELLSVSRSVGAIERSVQPRPERMALLLRSSTNPD